jgi:hypothetical protein
VFLKSRFKKDYRSIRRYYQACGDLMHKRRQLVRQYDDSQIISEIERLRSEIQLLANEI